MWDCHKISFVVSLLPQKHELMGELAIRLVEFNTFFLPIKAFRAAVGIFVMCSFEAYHCPSYFIKIILWKGFNTDNPGLYVKN